MPIVRRKLDENTVYPTNIRYNPDTDHVQSLVNGDWVDNPAADPRNQTTYPPRITGDSKCDAAQSVTDAIKNQIDSTITAVGNASTAVTIAGLILGLFTFGLFEIFISIALTLAHGMIDAGESALNAALDEDAYDLLKCILYCHFNSSGRLEDGGLAGVIGDINDQIGGLGAVVLSSLVALAGEGGINNLASLGTSTGDCSTCSCAVPCSNADNWSYGTVLSTTIESGGYIVFELSSVDTTGIHAVQWGTPAGTGCCCVVDWTIHDPDSLPGFWTSLCGASGLDTSINPTDKCVGGFAIYQNSFSAFTIGVRIRCDCDDTTGSPCSGDCF